jgi:hypothetical protein
MIEAISETVDILGIRLPKDISRNSGPGLTIYERRELR